MPQSRAPPQAAGDATGAAPAGCAPQVCVACRPPTGKDRKGSKQAKAARSTAAAAVLPFEVSIAGVVLLGIMLIMYTCHCVWVSEAMYSAPSIVMQTRQNDGTVKHFDDFREAYAWLRCAPRPLMHRLHIA